MSANPNLTFHRSDRHRGFRLTVLPTKKLKTILVKVYFPADLDESVTRKALLPMVLRRGTRNFPDMQKIQRHLENLYGASVAHGVVKVGEWHVVKLRLEALNGDFLPSGGDVFKESLEFLREHIFEPHMEQDVFRQEYVEQEKQNLARGIESLVDHKDQYALERLIQQMCADEPYHRYEYGSIRDLAEIDADTMVREWRHWSNELPCDVYVTGDVDVARIRDLFDEVFSASRPASYRVASVPPHVEVKETRHFEEKMAVNQGKLCLGFRCGINYLDGDLEALVVLNGILGSFSHSKLFQNVREKASLAYDVHSAVEKTKGLLFVVSGIAVENYGKALDIINEQVLALQKGDISETEIVSTRESFDNHLRMLEDNLSDLVEVDFIWKLHGRVFDLPRYREALRAVSLERVAEVATKLQLDSVFFLRD